MIDTLALHDNVGNGKLYNTLVALLFTNVPSELHNLVLFILNFSIHSVCFASFDQRPGEKVLRRFL
jgi:hypothetical protein